MPSQLGAAERARLRATHAHIQVTEPDPQGGRPLADLLRQALPDLDDVTIGRVLLAVGSHTGAAVEAWPDNHELRAISNQIVMAGVELTASEWQEHNDG